MSLPCKSCRSRPFGNGRSPVCMRSLNVWRKLLFAGSHQANGRAANDYSNGGDLLHISSWGSMVVVFAISAIKHTRENGYQEGKSSQAGRCDMQKSFAYSPVHKIIRNNFSSRRQLSIIAFVGAIMVLMISLALVVEQYGRSDSGVHSSLSPASEFSSGMPLP
jgi:hypothetical protein